MNRRCLFCHGLMYGSLSSVWIEGKNYDAHKKCLKFIKSSEKTSKEKEKERKRSFDKYCKCGNNPQINLGTCLNCGGKVSHI